MHIFMLHLYHLIRVGPLYIKVFFKESLFTICNASGQQFRAIKDYISGWTSQYACECSWQPEILQLQWCDDHICTIFVYLKSLLYEFIFILFQQVQISLASCRNRWVVLQWQCLLTQTKHSRYQLYSNPGVGTGSLWHTCQHWQAEG